MMTCNLNELRLLGSAQFDSECLLTVILCGDLTLPERFRSNELLALGSRIRFRRMLSPYDKKELRNYLEYCLEQAGATQLMTKPLMSALVEHSAGNLRLLNVMAAELLTVAAQRELTQLDEQLFLELYSPTPQKKQSR
jgi:type II secretory pathway predicted ATPase ExeA